MYVHAQDSHVSLMYSRHFFLGKSTFRAARPGAACPGGGESAGRVRHRGGAGSSETLPQLPFGDGFLQKKVIWIWAICGVG